MGLRMNEYNQRLQSTFLFTNIDLRANRSGQLSPRQQARLRATAGSQRLVLVVFGMVMLASLGLIMTLGVSTGEVLTGSLVGAAVAIGIIAVIVIIAYLVSRPYLTRANPRQAMLAKGKASVGRLQPEAYRYEILIGAARLRLSTEEHFQAFQPGVEYRVFYLPGPVTVILSGEVVGTEAESDPQPDEADALPADDVVVGLNRSGRWIVIVLGILAIVIPAAGIAASSLPPVMRWIVYAALLAVAIIFVYWALERLKN